MKLDVASFPVRDVAFGVTTRYGEGVLEINKQELLAQVLTDPRIRRTDIELARPGESVRITTVRDVIEPRIKASGLGMVYPGICGRPVATVGEGVTNRLAGLGVVEVAPVPLYLNPGSGSWPDRSLIDMRDRGEETSPYAELINICLLLEVDTSLPIEMQNDAAHRAALLLSDRLAATTLELKPADIETYELPEVDSSLPRVAYIQCHHSPEHHSGSITGWGCSLYGLTRLHPPWPLHPNELLGGALSFTSGAGTCSSWTHVNNPIVEELYRRHGVDINFTGCVIIRTRWSSQPEKDITALQAAQLLKVMGADGAVVSHDAGGNDFMEVIGTVQACENVGIQTVFVTDEEEPVTGGPPLLEPLPEARAIVSTGLGRTRLNPHDLLGVERVIGFPELTLDLSTGRGKVSAYDRLPWYRGHGWADRYGFSRITCYEH